MAGNAEIIYNNSIFFSRSGHGVGRKNAGCGPRRLNPQTQHSPRFTGQPWTYHLTSLCLGFLTQRWGACSAPSQDYCKAREREYMESALKILKRFCKYCFLLFALFYCFLTLYVEQICLSYENAIR